MKKENEKMKEGSKEKKSTEEPNFSSTIKNAHAAGDGSIKRSDETIDTPREASNKPPLRNNY